MVRPSLSLSDIRMIHMISGTCMIVQLNKTSSIKILKVSLPIYKVHHVFILASGNFGEFFLKAALKHWCLIL